MILDKYTLFFDNLKIATVIERDADFPSVSGDYCLILDNRSSALNQHILNYIAYSIELSRWCEITTSRQEFTDFCERNESEFIDLIETDNWYFLDEKTAKRQLILVPMFHSDREIGWRWNFIDVD